MQGEKRRVTEKNDCDELQGRKVDRPNPCDIGEVRREIMATEVVRLLKTQERMPRTDQTFATLAREKKKKRPLFNQASH